MITESTISSLSVYLTDFCNLNCKHCFLKASPQGKKHLDWNQIKTVLDYYRQQNYQIVEFTGGEACLSPFIRQAVVYARKIGFPFVGINTNGVSPDVINTFNPQELDKISFSLDGATAATHDKIRGKDSFKKTLATISQAIKLGFNSEVIFTINRYNLHQVKTIIKLLDQAGVTKLSFNFVSPIGNARRNTDILITPQQWVKARHQVESVKDLKNLTLRFPLMFVTKKEYQEMIPKGYQCILPNSSKTEIRPDGNIFHCCLTIENPRVVGGRIHNQQIVLDKEQEINFIKKHYHHACPARIPQTTSSLIPICVYYKKIIEPTSLS